MAMRNFLLAPIIILLVFGCQSKHKKNYKKCMDSGAKELYGSKLAQEFCNCFSDSILSSESPFVAGNKCAKPIIEEMLIEVK